MSNAVQIAKIVEAALIGDTGKVLSYARLVAEHFAADGDERGARIVRRSYGAELPGAPAALDSVAPGKCQNEYGACQVHCGQCNTPAPAGAAEPGAPEATA